MKEQEIKYCVANGIPLQIRLKSETCPKGYNNKPMTFSIMENCYWENVNPNSGQGVTFEYYKAFENQFEIV